MKARQYIALLWASPERKSNVILTVLLIGFTVTSLLGGFAHG